MPRPLPWIKLWLDSLHNHKLIRLSLAERGAWWGLVTLAGELGGYSSDGALTAGGQPLTLDEIADSLHLKPGDRPHLDSMVHKMVNQGSLAWNSHTLYVTNWEERQKVPNWWLPGSSTERVHRYRERQRQKPLNNPPLPSPDLDQEGEGEEEGNNNVTVTQVYERVNEARGHWKGALAQLRPGGPGGWSRANFSAWLAGSEALGYDQDGFLVVQVKTREQAGNLRRGLFASVRRAVIEVTGNELVDVRFVTPEKVRETA